MDRPRPEVIESYARMLASDEVYPSGVCRGMALDLLTEVRALQTTNWRLQEDMACRNEMSATILALRAENAKLRQERDAFSDAHEAAEQRIVELREELQEAEKAAEVYEGLYTYLLDKLRRLEELPAKWMDYVVLQTGEGIPDCANELEKALKGEP